MGEKFKKTSFVHKDIGEHEHEMVIFESYEVYAVCMKCGVHDWAVPEHHNGENMLELYKERYPGAEIVPFSDPITHPIK